jgi:hypothetical protein
MEGFLPSVRPPAPSWVPLRGSYLVSGVLLSGVETRQSTVGMSIARHSRGVDCDESRS